MTEKDKRTVTVLSLPLLALLAKDLSDNGETWFFWTTVVVIIMIIVKLIR